MYRSVLCSSLTQRSPSWVVVTAFLIGSRQVFYILVAIRTSEGTAKALITVT